MRDSAALAVARLAGTFSERRGSLAQTFSVCFLLSRNEVQWKARGLYDLVLSVWLIGSTVCMYFTNRRCSRTYVRVS